MLLRTFQEHNRMVTCIFLLKVLIASLGYKSFFLITLFILFLDLTFAVWNGSSVRKFAFGNL